MSRRNGSSTRRSSMATQKSQSNEATLNAGPATTKSRKPRAPKKVNGSASARSAAPRDSEAPTEVLFKDPPNPYAIPQPPYIWIDHPEQSERLLSAVYV